MTKMILDHRGYRLEYVVEGDRERVGILKDGREVMTAQNVGRAKEWIRNQVPCPTPGVKVEPRAR